MLVSELYNSPAWTRYKKSWQLKLCVLTSDWATCTENRYGMLVTHLFIMLLLWVGRFTNWSRPHTDRKSHAWSRLRSPFSVFRIVPVLHKNTIENSTLAYLIIYFVYFTTIYWLRLYSTPSTSAPYTSAPSTSARTLPPVHFRPVHFRPANIRPVHYRPSLIRQLSLDVCFCLEFYLMFMSRSACLDEFVALLYQTAVAWCLIITCVY